MARGQESSEVWSVVISPTLEKGHCHDSDTGNYQIPCILFHSLIKRIMNFAFALGPNTHRQSVPSPLDNG